MEHKPLINANSTPSSSIITIEPNVVQKDYLCYLCRNKLMKNQEIIHTPIECLSKRCQLLENEIIQLKDRDIKSRLYIKELENRITALDNAIKGLVAPTISQAAPYTISKAAPYRIGMGERSQSDALLSKKSQINYDNILPTKKSGSREHIGLFGSLGASSQHP